MVDWYEYPTNFSNNSQVDGVYDFFLNYPNSILGNSVAMGIIVFLWIGIFGLSLKSGASKAMLISGFITAIFAIMFWSLGILTIVVPIALILLTIVFGLVTRSEAGGGL